jgi:serine/threonine protein kinase
VKIADFGISKRVTEGLTALRTITGTLEFAAPELLGFRSVNDQADRSYTNAVDIWSTGAITYLILTGENFFHDLSRLGKYTAGVTSFPLGKLLARRVSESGCDFVKSLMAPNPQERLTVNDSLQHPWVHVESMNPGSRRYEVYRKLHFTCLQVTC